MRIPSWLEADPSLHSEAVYIEADRFFYQKCSAEKFGRWMTANKLNPSDVDECLIGHYIADIRRLRPDGGSQENLKAREGREHLMLQVLVPTEREVSAVIQMNQQMVERLGLPAVSRDEELRQMAEQTSIDSVAQTIQKNLSRE